jgi:hypothetical protein
MFDDKVIRGQDFRTPRLSSGEHFGGLEILEILLVTLHQDLVIGPVRIVSVLFRFLDNRKELAIVSVVGLFGGGAFLTVEIDSAKNPESVIAVEDARDGNATCIGLQNDRFLGVELLEDRGLGKGFCELSKCEFSIPNPFPHR